MKVPHLRWERDKMSQISDFRSDTVTKPTDAMREAMQQAVVGDDVYGEDETVRKLEQLAAELMGKEAGLFVTSGTQGNQVAIATHAGRGDEVIAESESHVFYYEAGAVAAIAGAQLRQLPGKRGVMDPDHIREAIRTPNIHHPVTKLICVENTHNRAGGTVIPAAVLRETATIAKEHGIAVHMDGARLFNAAVALNVPVAELAVHADSVQVCLSKGLCAPIGSVLVSSRDFIERARVWRKRLGGGMRQAGVIAAPGIVALSTMVSRLEEDHRLATRLATELASLPGLGVDLSLVDTNIVLVDIAETGYTVEEFLAMLAEEGFLATSFGKTVLRFVTHRDVSDADVDRLISYLTSHLRRTSEVH
jgi:threonine aldolase